MTMPYKFKDRRYSPIPTDHRRRKGDPKPKPSLFDSLFRVASLVALGLLILWLIELLR